MINDCHNVSSIHETVLAPLVVAPCMTGSPPLRAPSTCPAALPSLRSSKDKDRDGDTGGVKGENVIGRPRSRFPVPTPSFLSPLDPPSLKSCMDDILRRFTYP